MTPRVQTAIDSGIAVITAALFMAVLWRDRPVRAVAQAGESVAQDYAPPLEVISLA